MKPFICLLVGVLLSGSLAVRGKSFPEVELLPDGQLRLSWELDLLQSYQLEAAAQPSGPYAPVSGRLAGDSGSILVDLEPNTRSRFFRLAPLDSDASSYVTRAGLADPLAISSLSRWVKGLKALGLFEHTVYMAPLQQALNSGSGSLVHALKGPWGEIQGNQWGTPRWTANGIQFNADGFVSFPNPFAPGFLSEFSLLAVFHSDQRSTRLIVGSESRLQGPSLLAGGSVSQGPNAKELFFDYSADGFTPPSNYGHGGRRTFVRGNTGDPQMALATFSPDEVTCQANMDLRFKDQGVFPPAWNGHPTWRIGARLDEFFPFVGTISFVGIFDVPISDQLYDQVRRLYRTTLGVGLGLPAINVMIEGDSLSEESLIPTWGEALFEQPHWKGKFNKRNVSRGGDGIPEMLRQYEQQVLPFANQPGKNYLFIWGGAREIKERSGELAFADLRRYWKMARDAGYTIVAFTILPNGEPTPQVPPRRQRLNELIRAATADYDFLIDIASHPQLQDPFDLNYYLEDRVHLRWEANVLIAETINRLIPNP